MAALDEGKIPPHILNTILPESECSRSVLVGAAPGEDAAVVRGARRIVVTSDPVTFTEENMGTYVVSINANDIVAMGAVPVYLTTTALLPVGYTEENLRALFSDINTAASRAGIHWVGGHTEVTSAVNRVIVSGHAIGKLIGRPTTSANAKPGESIVMTKWAGLEGTTLLARKHRDHTNALLGKKIAAQVRNWLIEPGISICREGRILKNLRISAAHDPTEGGIATAIHEIAERSHVGVEICMEKIPVRQETQAICNAWNLNPLGLLSSGVLLFTAPPGIAKKALKLLQQENISAAVIGKTLLNPKDRFLIDKGESASLPRFVKDELLNA